MRYIFLLLALLLVSCKPKEKNITAQQIIDNAIVYSGADKVANSKITFNFRDKEYIATRQDGSFKLYRGYKKDSICIEDYLSNDNFERDIDKQKIHVPDSMVTRYSNSVNSVHYFSVLPFGLNDNAVNKKLLPATTVNGKEYYKIQVSFSEEGGGEDFDDIFIYWIGKEDFLVDYLAYSYHTNGGGMRFRVLKEQCIREGIRFVDYHNYKPLTKDISLIDSDKAFENNQLQKVSEIVLKDIEVTILE